MRTDQQRIARYNAKTDPATVRRKVAAMLPIMKANYAAHANEIVPVEEAEAKVEVKAEELVPRHLVLCQRSGEERGIRCCPSRPAGSNPDTRR